MIEFDGLPELTRPRAGRAPSRAGTTPATRHRGGRAPRAESGRPSRWPSSTRRTSTTSRSTGRRSSLVDGETRRIEWPTTRFSVCRPAGRRPATWCCPRHRAEHALARVLRASPRRSATSWRCEMVVLLGALLADAPHTRPVPVSGTSRRRGARPSGCGLEPDPLRGADRHRRRAAGRLHAGRASRRVVLGARCRTTSPSRPARRPRWRCCTGSRSVLDVPVPLATWPRRPRLGAAASTSWPSEDAEVAEYVRELEERAGREHDCPRPAARRSPGSSSATCAAGGRRGPAAPAADRLGPSTRDDAVPWGGRPCWPRRHASCVS